MDFEHCFIILTNKANSPHDLFSFIQFYFGNIDILKILNIYNSLTCFDWRV